MSDKMKFVLTNVDSLGRPQLLWDAASAHHTGPGWVRCRVTRAQPQYIPQWKVGDTVWVAVTDDPTQCHINACPSVLGLEILEDRPKEPTDGWAWTIQAKGTTAKYLLCLSPDYTVNADNSPRQRIYCVVYSDGSGTHLADWQSVLDWFGDIKFNLTKIKSI